MKKPIKDAGRCAHHELKCWPEIFTEVRAGRKTAEIRKCDRPFSVNDIIILREYCPDSFINTGAQLLVRVTHLIRGGQFGIEKGFVMMSIELVK